MKQSVLILAFTFANFNFSFANGWQPMGSGTDRAAITIFLDSINGEIYFGGQFFLTDSLPTRGIAKWNGVVWDSVGSGLKHFQTNRAISKYNNKLYSDGGFSISNINNILGSFDGFEWDTVKNGLDGSVYQMKVLNEQLYISGFFQSADGSPCNMLVTWNDTNFTCLNLPFDGWVGDFINYNNTLVFGGNFFDDSLNIDIALMDSTGFQLLGHPIYGGVSVVNSLAIYQGDLYVAGNFSSSAGNEGNNIMRWDGSQWYDVGGGTDNSIWKIKVFNGELYACGTFQVAGGILTGSIAKWNGTIWSSVTSSIIGPGISDFLFFNNDLYICGLFNQIDGVTMNNIAKYVGINQNISNNLIGSLILSPVPSGGLIKIHLQYGNLKEIRLYELTGKQVRSISCNSSIQELDISTLSPGLYFLDAISDQRTFRKRFVKN